MGEDSFGEYELDCIRKAAGRPEADIRPCEGAGGLRSRAYYLDGPQGRTFVKCLDSGYRNPLSFYLTLDHEAEGYRFFAGPWEELIAFPEVHFCQSFSGPAGQELQVLGMTNLRALGATLSPSDVYGSRSTAPEDQEQIARLCGHTMARLVSTEFQSKLDRASGAAAIRRQTEKFLNHPERGLLLGSIVNHPAIPWAYQNKVMGEMNVLLPRWLEVAEHEAKPETRTLAGRVRRVLIHPDVVQVLAPAQSLDRIIFSPRDRHDGNTLLAFEGGKVRRVYEIDLEFWGLETGGRLIGRYLAMMEASGRSRWAGHDRRLLEHLSRLMGALLFHFVLGDGGDLPDVVLRAVHVGVAGVHAATLLLHRAAAFRPAASALVEHALGCLGQPGRYLGLTAGYAASRPGKEAELVAETVEQVQRVMRPTYELITSLLGSTDGGPID